MMMAGLRILRPKRGGGGGGGGGGGTWIYMQPAWLITVRESISLESVVSFCMV